MSEERGQEAKVSLMPTPPANAGYSRPEDAQAATTPGYGWMVTSCNILAVLLLISIIFTETIYYKLCEITAASGLSFICHGAVFYYAPREKGITSLVLCFIAGPLFLWCLLTFLW